MQVWAINPLGQPAQLHGLQSVLTGTILDVQPKSNDYLALHGHPYKANGELCATSGCRPCIAEQRSGWSSDLLPLPICVVMRIRAAFQNPANMPYKEQPHATV